MDAGKEIGLPILEQRAELKGKHKTAKDSVKSLKNQIKELKVKLLEKDQKEEADEKRKLELERQISVLRNQVSALQTDIDQNRVIFDEVFAQKEGKSKIVAEVQVTSHVEDDLFKFLLEQLSCSICYAPFIEPIVTNCSHMFCSHCLAAWKRVRQACPLCLSKLTVECRVIMLDDCITKMMKVMSDKKFAERLQMIEKRNHLGEVNNLNMNQGVSIISGTAPTASNGKSTIIPASVLNYRAPRQRGAPPAAFDGQSTHWRDAVTTSATAPAAASNDLEVGQVVMAIESTKADIVASYNLETRERVTVTSATAAAAAFNDPSSSEGMAVTPNNTFSARAASNRSTRQRVAVRTRTIASAAVANNRTTRLRAAVATNKPASAAAGNTSTIRKRSAKMIRECDIAPAAVATNDRNTRCRRRRAEMTVPNHEGIGSSSPQRMMFLKKRIISAGIAN